MAKIREIRVQYVEREVLDPRAGNPVFTVESVLRLASFLRYAVDEEMWSIVLDGKRELVGMYQVSKGGRVATAVDPASLFRTALLVEGHGIIIAHNHPGGSPKPSAEDVRSTEHMVLAGLLLHVPVLDHVIIAGDKSYSFAQAGMLRFIEAKALQAMGVDGVPGVQHPDEKAKEVRAALATLGRKREEASAPFPLVEAVTEVVAA